MTTFHTAQVQGLERLLPRGRRPVEARSCCCSAAFPSSSHQFRNLIPALADRFHVLSPDYPGFGNTDMPDPATWDYTFDHLAEIVEGLLVEIGFTGPMGIYMQDYGGPIGNRIIARHPDWLAVAGHPERQHLRGGLHRRLGRHPPRPLGRPQPRDRGAARGVPRSPTPSRRSTRPATRT